MALVNVGDRFILEVWCKCREQYAMNARTLELTESAFTFPRTTEELMSALNNVMAGLYKAVLPVEALYYGVRLQRTHPSIDGPYSEVLSLQGNINSPSVPTQVATLIRMDTGRLGRRNKGRSYIPFIPLSFLTISGRLTNTAKARYADLVTAVRVGITLDIGGELATLRQIVRQTSVEYGEQYINASLSDIPATMRSRSMMYGPDEAPFT
jgi:hypothetical protein